eukprot:gene24255-32688_t
MKRSIQVGSKPVKAFSPISNKSSPIGSDGSNIIKNIKVGLSDNLNIKERIKEEKGLRRLLSFPHNFDQNFSTEKKNIPEVHKVFYISAETQTENVSNEDPSNAVIIRNLQEQVESLESLLRESAQYITQLSEQYMSSLDEVSILTAKVEDLMRKESEANEKNKVLQSKVELMVIEIEKEKSSNIKRRPGSKPSSRRDYYQFEEVKYDSSDDDAIIRELIQSNASVMNGSDELEAVYLEILKDLKHSAESSCDKLVSADDETAHLLSMFPNIVFEEKKTSASEQRSSSSSGSAASSSSSSLSSSSSSSSSSKRGGRRRGGGEPGFLFGSPSKRYPILSNPAFEEDEEEEQEDDDPDDYYDEDGRTEIVVATDDYLERLNSSSDGAEEDKDGERDILRDMNDKEGGGTSLSEFELYLRYGHDPDLLQGLPSEDAPIVLYDNAMLKAR